MDAIKNINILPKILSVKEIEPDKINIQIERVNNGIQLNIDNNSYAEYDLNLFNILGESFVLNPNKIGAGINSIQINNLNSGVYYFFLRNDKNFYKKKMVID